MWSFLRFHIHFAAPLSKTRLKFPATEDSRRMDCPFRFVLIRNESASTAVDARRRFKVRSPNPGALVFSDGQEQIQGR